MNPEGWASKVDTAARMEVIEIYKRAAVSTFEAQPSGFILPTLPKM